MIIEGNEKEIEAMEQFHKGNCGYKKNSQLHSERNIKIKIIVLARKPAAIMEIVKSVLRYIEHIKNMYQIV